MKKDLLICLVVFMFGIMYVVLIVMKNKSIYVENKNLHICQQCIIKNGDYYCQVYDERMWK